MSVVHAHASGCAVKSSLAANVCFESLLSMNAVAVCCHLLLCIFAVIFCYQVLLI